jgi:excisionase family DNA binding protein
MDEQLPVLAVGIAEAARLTTLGRTKIYALIRDKQRRVTRIGRRTLIPIEALRELVEKGPE